MTHRYCDLERRVLIWFHNNPEEETIVLESGFDIMVMNLVADGLLIDITDEEDERFSRKISGLLFIEGMPLHREYKLTDFGRNFSEKWMKAQLLE